MADFSVRLIVGQVLAMSGMARNGCFKPNLGGLMIFLSQFPVSTTRDSRCRLMTRAWQTPWAGRAR